MKYSKCVKKYNAERMISTAVDKWHAVKIWQPVFSRGGEDLQCTQRNEKRLGYQYQRRSRGVSEVSSVPLPTITRTWMDSSSTPSFWTSSQTINKQKFHLYSEEWQSTCINREELPGSGVSVTFSRRLDDSCTDCTTGGCLAFFCTKPAYEAWRYETVSAKQQTQEHSISAQIGNMSQR